jgi:LysR family hca operon transcriptional activator
MELRHLHYFVAVAGAERLTVAAEQTLHTSQPSLSRQIRDLEDEVGARPLMRRARPIELTPAGPRLSRIRPRGAMQVEAAAEAARRVAQCRAPPSTSFDVTGHRSRHSLIDASRFGLHPKGLYALSVVPSGQS